MGTRWSGSRSNHRTTVTSWPPAENDLGAFARTPLSPASSDVTVQLNFKLEEQGASDFGLFGWQPQRKTHYRRSCGSNENLATVTEREPIIDKQTPVSSGVWHTLRVNVQTGSGLARSLSGTTISRYGDFQRPLRRELAPLGCWSSAILRLSTGFQLNTTMCR